MTVEYIWNPLLLFIATPYLLRSLGAEGFGFWMLFSGTLGFGVAVNSGTSIAIIKQISACIGLSERKEINSIVCKSLAVAIYGGGVLAAIIFTIFGFFGELLFSRMGDPHIIFMTGFFCAILIWVEQIDNVFGSTLKGAEKFSYAARIELVGKALQITSVVIAALIFKDVLVLYQFFLFFGVIRLLLKMWLVRALLEVVSFTPNFFGLHNTIHIAKWGWVQGIGGLFFGTIDRMLIGGFLGASSLTSYSIATQLAVQIHAIPSAFFGVVFPRISRELSDDKNYSIRQIAKLTILGNIILSTFLALALLVYGENIIMLWVGVSQAEDSGLVFKCLIIAYWLLSINVAPHFLMLGIGRYRFLSLSNIVAGIVSLMLMCMLIQEFELIGVGIARIAYGIIIFINCFSLYEYLKNQTKKYAK